MKSPGAAFPLRITARTSSSFENPWYSELCHLKTMWMRLLATNTRTAESRMGIQSWSREGIESSFIVGASAGTGAVLT